MSFPTQPAHIHNGGFNAESRKHPVLEWMEDYTRNAIDSRSWGSGTPYWEWHTEDWTLQTANGAIYHGGENAWKEGIPSVYSLFKAHLHEPNFAVTFETSDGWEMIGQADMYAYLPVPGSEQKIKDPSGKEWDCVTNSAFHFYYVKDEKAKHHGMLLKKTMIFADSGPALMLMLKRGQVKLADLGL
ncbi:MAG: hypothetical protein Q9218_004958 [Villophora microphyllina]